MFVMQLIAVVVGIGLISVFVKSLRQRDFKNSITAFAIFLGLCGLLGALDLRSSSVAPTSAANLPLSSSQEFIWIRNNQRLIAKRLKDPGSAKFGNDFVSYKSGAPVVCGTVNAKNSFGAYSGATRYIGAGETIGTYMEGEAKDFDDLWRKVCG